MEWDDFKTRVENSTSKVLLATAAMGEWLRAHNATLRALGEAVGVEGADKTAKPNAGVIDRSQEQAAKQAAAAQKALDNEIQEQELDNIKTGIEAYRQGSAERLAQVRMYAEAAAKYYGSNEIDIVRAAKRAEIAEERAYGEEKERIARAVMQEGIKANDKHVAAVLKGIAAEIDADGRYLADQQQIHDAIRSMEETGLELQQHIWRDRAQNSAKLRALTEQETREQFARWNWLSNSIESSFTGAIQGMLAGTESFGGAVRSIFTSLVDALVQEMVRMAVEWIEQLVLTKLVQKTTAASGIAANAGLAASAAMASVAAIPFVGWAMAPGVGAATFAEAMAYESVTAVAERGYDVPPGISPVTRLHPEEMVLPRTEANAVRDMASGGRRGGSMPTVPFRNMGGGYMLIHEGNLAQMIKKLGGQFKLS